MSVDECLSGQDRERAERPHQGRTYVSPTSPCEQTKRDSTQDENTLFFGSPPAKIQSTGDSVAGPTQ